MRVQTQLCQNLFRVLTQCGWRCCIGNRCTRHFHGAGHQGQCTIAPRRDIHTQGACFDLGIIEDAVYGVDGAARKALFNPQGAPFINGFCIQALLQQADQKVAVGHALGVGRKPAIVSDLGATRRSTQGGKLGVVTNRQHDVAVGACKGLIRHNRRVGAAQTARHLATQQVVARLVGQGRHLHIQQGHVDMLAFSGSGTRIQRRQNGGCGVQTGENIHHGHTHFLGPAPWHGVGFTRDAHQTTHGLDQGVVTRTLGVGAGLTKPGN